MINKTNSGNKFVQLKKFNKFKNKKVKMKKRPRTMKLIKRMQGITRILKITIKIKKKKSLKWIVNLNKNSLSHCKFLLDLYYKIIIELKLTINNNNLQLFKKLKSTSMI
jgi:hypothetical protein